MSPGPGTVRQTAGLGVQDREEHLTDEHTSPLVQLSRSWWQDSCSVLGVHHTDRLLYTFYKDSLFVATCLLDQQLYWIQQQTGYDDREMEEPRVML